MTDITEIQKPAKPRKRHRAKRKAARAEPPPITVEYPGLTVTNCAAACGPAGCCLGTAYCAHPRKGGLQAADMGNHEILGRLNDARKQLARADAEKRFE